MNNWGCILSIIEQSLSILSFLTNSLLIFLVFTSSPKTMGSYKYIMIFTSVFEMAYGLVHFLIKPEIISKDSYVLEETNSQKSLIPLSVARMLLCEFKKIFFQ